MNNSLRAGIPGSPEAALQHLVYQKSVLLPTTALHACRYVVRSLKLSGHCSHPFGGLLVIDQLLTSDKQKHNSVISQPSGLSSQWLVKNKKNGVECPPLPSLERLSFVKSCCKRFLPAEYMSSPPPSYRTRRVCYCLKDGERDFRHAVDLHNLSVFVEGARTVQILKGCSLQVPEGALFMLLGPNGCGKSTLLKTLAGLLKIDSDNGGTMSVAHPRSFVFQNPDHQVVMPTVGADVAFGLGTTSTVPDEEVRGRVKRALELVGMQEYIQRPIQTLSGGQKQRVAIAGALAENSKLLLLDELTTYLDYSDQMSVLSAVKAVVGRKRGVTAIWVTHRLEELEYADGAAYMEEGRIVVSGSAADVRKHIDKLRKRDIPSLNLSSVYSSG